MGVTYSRATLETTLEQLSRLYYTYRRSLTQTAPKKAEEVDASYRRGIAEGMAAFLFLHRSNSLPRFKSLPPIYESDVRAILDASASDYINGTPAEKANLTDGLIDALLALAVPKELVETDEAERRRLVIAGEEVAKPSDAEWINELAAKKRQEMEELVQLLQPLDLPPKSKVNYPKQSDALLRCTRDDCAHLPEHRRSRHEYMMRSSQPAESEAAVSHVDD